MTMLRIFGAATLVLVCALSATRGEAQTFPTDDPVIQAIWDEGMEAGSQIQGLAQTLLDSIGPRLSGSPGQRAAINWVASRYEAWGVPARVEEYAPGKAGTGDTPTSI